MGTGKIEIDGNNKGQYNISIKKDPAYATSVGFNFIKLQIFAIVVANGLAQKAAKCFSFTESGFSITIGNE
jgi:hypothetical protein